MKIYVIKENKRRAIAFLIPVGMTGEQFRNFKSLYQDEIKEAKKTLKTGQKKEIRENPEITETVRKIFLEQEAQLTT